MARFLIILGVALLGGLAAIGFFLFSQTFHHHQEAARDADQMGRSTSSLPRLAVPPSQGPSAPGETKGESSHGHSPAFTSSHPSEIPLTSFSSTPSHHQASAPASTTQNPDSNTSLPESNDLHSSPADHLAASQPIDSLPEGTPAVGATSLPLPSSGNGDSVPEELIPPGAFAPEPRTAVERQVLEMAEDAFLNQLQLTAEPALGEDIFVVDPKAWDAAEQSYAAWYRAVFGDQAADLRERNAAMERLRRLDAQAATAPVESPSDLTRFD